MSRLVRVLLVLLSLASLQSCLGKHRCHVVSPFEHTSTDEWVHDSLSNMSDWRSTLMKEAHRRHKALHGTDEDRVAAAKLLRGFPVYQLYQPFMSCPPPMKLMYYGPKRKLMKRYSEGGKWACGPLPQKECIVYSLGSNKDFRFEEAILRETSCKIWTFDCTVPGKQLHKTRHRYEQLCIGEGEVSLVNTQRVENSTGLAFARLEDIMKRLNHTQITYLKIDIEGSEIDVMELWREVNRFLPLQVAVEVHQWQHRYSDVAMYLRHMADLGYAVVAKEDNVGAPIKCCAELLLLKVEQRVCGPHDDILGNMLG